MTIKKILGLVCTLAIMVTITAYAEANATSVAIPAPTTGEMSYKESPVLWGIQPDTIAPLQAPSDPGIAYSARTTATGMIGQPVTTVSGKKIGVMKDIILDSTGKAVLSVISDGGFIGVGDKLTAFDYGLVVQQNADGDVVMPISADTIARAQDFSYDTKEASDDIAVMPNNGYSVSQLLRGKILDPQSRALGDVENIVFRGGQASQVIVAYDRKAGIGKDRAALDFNDMTIARQANGTIDFRMNGYQSAEFETYKGITY
jgi:sporulation protein YlmC with PRC-barrel domain